MIGHARRHGAGGASRSAVLLLAQALVLAGLVEVEGASPTREGVVTQGTTRRTADALRAARGGVGRRARTISVNARRTRPTSADGGRCLEAGRPGRSQSSL